MAALCPNALYEIAFLNNSTGCTSDTTFSFATVSAPSPDLVNRICTSAACLDVIAAIKDAQPNECTVENRLLLYTQLITPIESTCNRTSNIPSLSPTPPPTTVIPIPLVTPSPPQRPATVVTEKVSSDTTLSYSGFAVLLVVVVAAAFFASRCYRKRVRQLERKRSGEGFEYTEDILENPQEHETTAVSAIGPLHNGLAAVRIQFTTIRLDHFISSSGNGEVFRGMYNDQLVAIKRLPPGRRKDATSIQNFFAEIQLTSSLEHECIVQFVGVAWASLSDLCMVSEFMPGGDLRALLARYAENGHPNGHDNDKLKIAIQVAHALTYLHTLSTPVVHRDLKSRNILLSSEGDAKIMDFGISCERRDVTMTAGVGTTLWMAPEVMLGQRYDEKADVFSFGVILSELDTHAMPYDHARDPGSDRLVADTVLMHLVSEGTLKPRFTNTAVPEIVELANACIQLDPASRPRSSEILCRIRLLISAAT